MTRRCEGCGSTRDVAIVDSFLLCGDCAPDATDVIATKAEESTDPEGWAAQ